MAILHPGICPGSTDMNARWRGWDRSVSEGRQAHLAGIMLRPLFEVSCRSVLSILNREVGCLAVMHLTQPDVQDYFSASLNAPVKQGLIRLHQESQTPFPSGEVIVEQLPRPGSNCCSEVLPILKSVGVWGALRMSVSGGVGAFCFHFLIPLREGADDSVQLIQHLKDFGGVVRVAGRLAIGEEMEPSGVELSNDCLTARQYDVVLLVMEGHTNAEIAKQLGISLSTVKCHLADAFFRLNVSNRAGLVAAMHRKQHESAMTNVRESGFTTEHD